MSDLGKWDSIDVVSLGKWNKIDASNLDKINGLTISTVPARTSLDRAVLMSGYLVTGAYDSSEYFSLLSSGNSLFFGLTTAVYESGGFSNGDLGRAVQACGYNIQNTAWYRYITISSLGNAIQGVLGDNLRRATDATDNNTNDRGVVANGTTEIGVTEKLEYTTTSTLASADFFGNALATRNYNACLSNGVNERGLTAGNFAGIASANSIEYFTINSLASCASYGNLLSSNYAFGGCSNLTDERGIFFGGSGINLIQFCTINSLGNTLSFGNTTGLNGFNKAVSSGTYQNGVVVGGYNGSSRLASMENVTINTLSNSANYGSILNPMMSMCVSSDSV